MVKAKEWLSFWLFGFTYSFTLILIVFDFVYLKIIVFPLFLEFIFMGLLMGAVILRLIIQKQLGKFFSVNIKIHRKHQLIQTGIYKYLRHPMYAGNILIFIGLAGVFSSILGIFATVILVFSATLYRINREEYFLLNKFGKQYKKYQEKTKKLIPWMF